MHWTLCWHIYRARTWTRGGFRIETLWKGLRRCLSNRWNAWKKNYWSEGHGIVSGASTASTISPANLATRGWHGEQAAMGPPCTACLSTIRITDIMVTPTFQISPRAADEQDQTLTQSSDYRRIWELGYWAFQPSGRGERNGAWASGSTKVHKNIRRSWNITCYCCGEIHSGWVIDRTCY